MPQRTFQHEEKIGDCLFIKPFQRRSATEEKIGSTSIKLKAPIFLIKRVVLEKAKTTFEDGQ